MSRHFPFVCIAACVAMVGLHPLEGEEKPTLTLPAGLLPDEPPLVAEKNGLVALLGKLEKPDEAAKKAIQEALNRVRSGESVDDPALILALQERHKLAVTTLKAPVQCPRSKDFAYLTEILLPLYMGIEILSWQDLRQGNPARATRYLEDGLRWSDLIRKGNPTLIEASVASAGWNFVFQCALTQWEQSEDQKAGLETIDRLFREHRMLPVEYLAVFKRESQYWLDSGGTKGMLLALAPETTLEFMLREPFDSLTAAQVLELPYDPGIEASKFAEIRSRILKHLRAGDPLDRWPRPGDLEDKVTIDDYRKRPNGLGDLCYEQHNNLSEKVIAANLFRDPAIATCIAWLKAEGEGRDFLDGDPGIARDPVDGKQLRIDTEARLIKSIASEQEAHTGPGEPVMEVPEWRDRS